MSRSTGPAPFGSFRTQLVVLTAAVTALVAVVLTIVVQLVLAAATDHSVDTVLADRTEAVIGSASTGPDGRLVVPDDRLDAGVAVYDAGGDLVAGSAPSADAAVYGELATTSRTRTVDRPGAEERRIRAEPFAVSGETGVVVVTERLAPYENGERLALFVCVGAGGLMILLAAGLAHWVSRRALAPVVAMTRAADDWSEHDLALRFDPGPGRNELAALGRTLDRLLERVATAIRSEQRLTSELAHELRTPLTAVRLNVDLLLLDPELPSGVRDRVEEVGDAARRMSSAIESLLELARTASSQALAGSCRLRDAVTEALGTDRAGVEVDVDPEQRVLLPSGLTARTLAPVLDNARRLAGRVVVSAEPDRPGFLVVRVDDDGPGIGPDDRERVFEPGHTSGAGAGLGLPLARRIARSMGGDVVVTDGPMSTRLAITLPCP